MTDPNSSLPEWMEKSEVYNIMAHEDLKKALAIAWEALFAEIMDALESYADSVAEERVKAYSKEVNQQMVDTIKKWTTMNVTDSFILGSRREILKARRANGGTK